MALQQTVCVKSCPDANETSICKNNTVFPECPTLTYSTKRCKLPLRLMVPRRWSFLRSSEWRHQRLCDRKVHFWWCWQVHGWSSCIMVGPVSGSRHQFSSQYRVSDAPQMDRQTYDLHFHGPYLRADGRWRLLRALRWLQLRIRGSHSQRDDRHGHPHLDSVLHLPHRHLLLLEKHPASCCHYVGSFRLREKHNKNLLGTSSLLLDRLLLGGILGDLSHLGLQCGRRWETWWPSGGRSQVEHHHQVYMDLSFVWTTVGECFHHGLCLIPYLCCCWTLVLLSRRVSRWQGPQLSGYRCGLDL